MRGLAEDNVFGTLGFGHLLDVTETARHRGHVDRGVAAADHHHAAGNRLEAALVEGFEERHAGDAVTGLGARYRERPAGLAANGEQHGIEIGFEVFKRHIHADARLEFDRDAHVDDAIHLAVQRVARQTVAGHAVLGHAAELIVIVVHGDAMTLAP